jgi:hypothetical protein
MNNSKRIVELLTKSPDLLSRMQRRKQHTLWQRVHNGNGTAKKSGKSSMTIGLLDKEK